MPLPRRFTAPVVGLLLAGMTAACGTQPSASAAPASASSARALPSATADAAVDDVATREAYNAAICPLFTAILELDPRLAAMRSAGAQGGDMVPHAAEVDAISDELLALLKDLEAVPEWTSGADLRFQLITALHGIRARLLGVADELAASDAADQLANLPFIASDAMDLAMQDALAGGLSCGGGS